MAKRNLTKVTKATKAPADRSLCSSLWAVTVTSVEGRNYVLTSNQFEPLELRMAIEEVITEYYPHWRGGKNGKTED